MVDVRVLPISSQPSSADLTLRLNQADEDRPASPSASAPNTPSEPSSPPSSFNQNIFDSPRASSPTQSPFNTPGSPGSNGSAGSPIGSSNGVTPFRRGHGRQQSLGTTTTSPSTRRRSLESTISLIKEVVDGKSAQGDTEQVSAIAETLSSPVKTKVRTSLIDDP